MVKNNKHFILGVRKENKTDRERISTMIICNKKKEQSKRYCRVK